MIRFWCYCHTLLTKRKTYFFIGQTNSKCTISPFLIGNIPANKNITEKEKKIIHKQYSHSALLPTFSS